MFRLYQSNNLERLAGRLSELIATPVEGTPVLARETIVVQSQGMHHWLSMQIAQRLGVTANIAFPFPDAFARGLFDANVPARQSDRFSPNALLWSVLGLLPEFERDPDFKAVADYLEHDPSGTKAFQLADRLANLFDGYGIYRPEMLMGWTHGDAGNQAHAVWQAAAWRRIAAGAEHHQPAARQRQLLRNDTPLRGLPPRVFVFGITSLPPYHLQVLEHVSRSVDVHMFVQSPCEAFWAHAQSERDVHRGAVSEGLSVEQFRERYHHETGNPLLASMGAHIRDFSMMLQSDESLPVDEESLYVTPAGTGLLGRLQRHIFNFEDGGEITGEARELSEGDRSVQLHVCHSPMREVQVLRDQLLDLLSADETSDALLPNDVVVMIPDIETYAPYIDAVFSVSRDDPHHIPFCISDRSSGATNAAASFLMSVLGLPETRFSSRDVMQYLENPLVRDRFGFSESETEDAARLIVESRIRWGFDPEQREHISGIPSSGPTHTWMFGLERLLLGYALPGEGTELFEGRLPEHSVEGGDAVTAGKLAHFARQLKDVHDALQRPRTVSSWCRFAIDLMQRFLLPTRETQPALDGVRCLVAEMGDDAQRAEFSDTINVAVFAAAIGQRLEHYTEHGRYMTRGVTFCSLLPFRGVPFKVVCLLGMNDQSFPRRGNPPAFDLMSAFPRLGDRSIRDDDRYMFIEAILSARERLLVSYTGRNIRDNALCPPAPVVSELTEYIDRCFECGDDGVPVSEQLTVEHPLQPFSERYFDGSDPLLFSYSTEVVAALNATGRSPVRSADRFAAPIPLDEPVARVPVTSFCRFFANPSRFFLNTRLHVFSADEDVELEENEPFSVGGLDRHVLTQGILGLREAGRTDADIKALMTAQGLLPHGVAAAGIMAQALERVDTFRASLAEVSGGQEEARLELAYAHAELVVEGELSGYAENTLIAARCGRIRDVDLVRIWIHHLLANSVRPIRSEVLGIDAKGKPERYSLNALASERDADVQLHGFVDTFVQGQEAPVRFFADASMAYVRAWVKTQDTDKALEAADTAWWGSDFGGGPSEASNDYHAMIYGAESPLDEAFCEVSQRLLLPLAETIYAKTKTSTLKPLSK